MIRPPSPRADAAPQNAPRKAISLLRQWVFHRGKAILAWRVLQSIDPAIQKGKKSNNLFLLTKFGFVLPNSAY
jgi:hypothetical protein